MTEIVREQPIDDSISIVVLKRDGEPPYTQIIPSKINRIEKLRKYVRTNHGGKGEFYQQQLDLLLKQFKIESQQN